MIDNITTEQEKELVNLLKDYTDYIPLLLLDYAPTDYLHNATDEAEMQIFQVRNEQPRQYTEREKYLKNDLQKWLEQNPSFKDIIKTE